MTKNLWTRDELLIALNLYYKFPYGQFHTNNPIILEVAQKLKRTSSALVMKLCNFGSLDPRHKLRGVQGLKGISKADQQIWQEFESNWTQLALESEEKFQNLLEKDALITPDVDGLTAANFSGNQKTETEATRKVRIGQTFFRNTILALYNYRCCLTGNPISVLLTASHILPWSQFPEQRLNPQNGLCLARTHDVAFDRGLITFDDDLKLVIGSEIEKKAQDQGSETLKVNFINYRSRNLNIPMRFAPDRNFLKYHRNHIFQG
jgi:putative restriction endonuclease